MDFDTPKWNEQQKRMISPGAEACAWWSSHFSEIWKRWPVSAGKDPGEAFKNGVDLRVWILGGLPPAFSIQSPVAPAKPASAPVVPYAAQPEPEKQVVVTMRTATDGRTFYITENKTEYARLVADGEIVFDHEEILLAIKSGATPEEAAHFLTVKQVFPGTRITEVIPEAG